MSEEHGENEHREAVEAIPDTTGAGETQETDDWHEEEEEEEDDDDDEQGSSKPDSLLDTKDLAKQAEGDRASSQRRATVLLRDIHEIIDLDELEKKQREEEKIDTTEKPLRSLFWYGTLGATNKVSGSGSWMACKLSNIFASIENWGTETLKKNAKWIGSIPFLGPWLFGKPEKTLEEREKEQKKEEEKHEKEAKAKNKEAAKKAETKLKEDERKLKAAVDKANKDFEKKNKPKTSKIIEEKK